jgi:hypothetical protein
MDRPSVKFLGSRLLAEGKDVLWGDKGGDVGPAYLLQQFYALKVHTRSPFMVMEGLASLLGAKRTSRILHS